MQKLTIEVTYKSNVDGRTHKVKFYNKEHMSKYVDEKFFEIIQIENIK